MNAEKTPGKGMVYICNDCGFLSDSTETASAHFTDEKTKTHKLRLYTYAEATSSPARFSK
jgi:hypothetical protein